MVHLFRALAAGLLAVLASASPEVQLSLETSFGGAPLLIELLETAAIENADSYPFLLERIAHDDYGLYPSDEAIYSRFLRLLREDSYFKDPHARELFELSFATRSAAPRIEAHFNHYESIHREDLAPPCSSWVDTAWGKNCTVSELTASDLKESAPLPFDRILGNRSSEKEVVFYSDLSFPNFNSIYLKIAEATASGLTVRVRYLPKGARNKPVQARGYGAQLVLKKTDYLVIDDRAKGKDAGTVKTRKPPTPKQIEKLSLRAASYVLDAKAPLDGLVDFSQNFPEYLNEIISYPLSDELMDELRERPAGIHTGFNGFWVNGLRVKPEDVDPFYLSRLFNKELRHMKSFRSLGLTPNEALDLVSHFSVNKFYEEVLPQRFVVSDQPEKGDVIIWLNDIEKDDIYKTWSISMRQFVQRSPTDLPPYRRNLHTLIVPLDLAKRSDASMFVNALHRSVHRRAPVRIGVVPLLSSETSREQAVLVHGLAKEYGVNAIVDYLNSCIKKGGSTCPADQESYDEISLKHDEQNPTSSKSRLTFEKVMETQESQSYLERAESYGERLNLQDNERDPILFSNGVPFPRDSNWAKAAQKQLLDDTNWIQREIYQGMLTQRDITFSLFQRDAALRRNPAIVPQDRNEAKIVDLVEWIGPRQMDFSSLPTARAKPNGTYVADDTIQLVLVTDFDSDAGQQLLKTTLEFVSKRERIDLVFIHDGERVAGKTDPSSYMWDNRQDLRVEYLLGVLNGAPVNSQLYSEAWEGAKHLISGLKEHNKASLILNGRFVNVPEDLKESDLNLLLSYERIQRLGPIHEAAKDLGLFEKIRSAGEWSKLCSVVASALLPPASRRAFEDAFLGRTSFYNRMDVKKGLILAGNKASASIQVVMLLDPLTELAQKWSAIAQTISQLDAISVKIIMNPQIQIKEIPIRRFYRYMMAPRVEFAPLGEIIEPKAIFDHLPADTLFTAGLDVPTSWIVSSTACAHDLDNIHLSESDIAPISATYEIENILVEGHAIDLSTGGAARGVQLLLNTATGALESATIVMANMGYFQLKANPGHYSLDLKEGPSSAVFELESISNTDGAEIAVLDFEGVNTVVMMKRKPKMEEVDVLSFEEDTRSWKSWFSKQWNALGKPQQSSQAEINIFSIASGHLYERMLSIMIVSVMKHTSNSVKFWFIEQFLSPSFKAFIPELAKEYGFQYEMVSYKWPSWLRAQSEKQREIWGYKILFLDVLFPLNLDKIIFIDADQIVRTNMKELVDLDLQGAPYGFTPMCDSRMSIEPFRFWKTGYWKHFLKGKPYHISALYVVDLVAFRALAAGDRLRHQYHQLSADPTNLDNLDQDLPNNMQFSIPIHSLPQEWLWCETWCEDEGLETAKTVDLCNNPMTKEPKLDRARRILPEWTEYDDEISAFAKRITGARNRRPPGRQVSAEEDMKDEL